jgi:hypothetical protein
MGGTLTLVLLSLLEGAASCTLASRDIIGSRWARPTLLERIHTEHDPDLGWIHRPDFFEPDLYGAGVYLRTNSLRFRSNREIPKAVPEGTTRIVCSGDSFTLGYGVSNDDTWCAQLETAGNRIETVNMGQGGYGVDQAYLWYKRDGDRVDHDLVILAVIETDFDRMMADSMLGLRKPLLVARDGRLETENAPVPDTSYTRSAAGAVNELRRFRIYELMTYVASKLGAGNRARYGEPYESEIHGIFSLLLDDMKQVATARGARLVVVFLPVSSGETERIRTAGRRSMVRAESERLGVEYLDLVAQSESLFCGGFNPSLRWDGHYSVAANKAVAAALMDRLELSP